MPLWLDSGEVTLLLTSLRWGPRDCPSVTETRLHEESEHSSRDVAEMDLSGILRFQRGNDSHEIATWCSRTS